jgi:hypothetical protein
MTDRYILDAAGTPQRCPDLLTWGQWMATADRSVADTTFGEVRVSTVFLGLDHHFGLLPGPPVLWESMVFGGPLDGEQRRYTSSADADAGHTALCMAVVLLAEGERTPTDDAKRRGE